MYEQLTETEWRQRHNITGAHCFEFRVRFAAAGKQLNAFVQCEEWEETVFFTDGSIRLCLICG